MKEDQQQLTFEKGITNVPSDILCSDNALAESVGMIYDNGEHKVIQKPEGIIDNMEGTLLFIHKFNDDERYVYRTRRNLSVDQYVYSLKWRTKNDSTANTVWDDYSNDPEVQISSIGKTLIVKTSETLRYFIWKSNEYMAVHELPDLEVEFWLKGGAVEVDLPDNVEGYDENTYPYTVQAVLHTNGILSNDDFQLPHIDNGKQEEYNNLVNALYSKNKNQVSAAKGFCLPFMARAAFRLYDGTYYKITNPVALFPSVTRNSYARYFWSGETMRLYTVYSELCCKVTGISSDYSDIISGVEIFVSKGVDIYDTLKDQPVRYAWDGDTPEMIFDGVYHTVNEPLSKYRRANASHQHLDADDWADPQPTSFRNLYFSSETILAEKTEQEIITDMKETSVFYNVCSLGTDGYEGSLTEKMESHVLENTTEQTQLGDDDYFSRSRMEPQMIYTYNMRLNLMGVRRTLFEGYDYFMPYDHNKGKQYIYDFYVTIRTDEGDKTVHHQSKDTKQKQGLYFFYPDSRATKVMIFRGSVCVCDQKLEEHKD